MNTQNVILILCISLILAVFGCNPSQQNNENNKKENIEAVFAIDSSNLDFLKSEMSLKEVQEYEKNLCSGIIGIDFNKGYSTTDINISLSSDVTSDNFLLDAEVEVNEEIYPYSKEVKLESPEIYMRQYKNGLQLKTSYFFNDEKIALQIHEWGAFGIDSLKNLKQTDFENIYIQIQEKITEIKGMPVDSLSNNSFDNIWDNNNENIRLKLNDLDSTYNIKLYQYKKINTSH